MEDQQPASGDLTDGTPDEQDSAQDEDTAVDEAADATPAKEPSGARKWLTRNKNRVAVIASVVLSLVLAVAVGVLSATRQYSKTDYFFNKSTMALPMASPTSM